jgi:hypothetical protein
MEKASRPENKPYPFRIKSAPFGNQTRDLAVSFSPIHLVIHLMKYLNFPIRIRSTSTRDEVLRKQKKLHQPSRLQDLAVQSVIASKENFFEPGLFPGPLVDYIAREYNQYHVCHYCNSAEPLDRSGYKVFTFKTPYLGKFETPYLGNF